MRTDPLYIANALHEDQNDQVFWDNVRILREVLTGRMDEAFESLAKVDEMVTLRVLRKGRESEREAQ